MKKPNGRVSPVRLPKKRNDTTHYTTTLRSNRPDSGRHRHWCLRSAFRDRGFPARSPFRGPPRCVDSSADRDWYWACSARSRCHLLFVGFLKSKGWKDESERKSSYLTSSARVSVEWLLVIARGSATVRVGTILR